MMKNTITLIIIIIIITIKNRYYNNDINKMQ